MSDLFHIVFYIHVFYLSYVEDIMGKKQNKQ